MDEPQRQVTPDAMPESFPQAPAAAVVELLGRDGRAAGVQRVARWPVRIGRSPACDIVLDDPHLAAEHAELAWAPGGGVTLKLLDSRNGGSVAGRALAAGAEAALPASGVFHLAGSTLRLRTSDDRLAPEQLLIVQPVRHWALVPLLLLVMLVVDWAGRWSDFDPDTRWVAYATPMLAQLAFMLAWAGLWSVASQLFQHRFPFTTHLRRLLAVMLGLQLVEWLLPAVAYAFSWPRLMVLESLSVPVALSLLVGWHARLVWPGAQRMVFGGIAALLVVGLGLQAAGRQEQQYLFGPPYLASLPPPALRLAPAQPPETLIEALQPLKAELARQARKDNEGADEESD